MARPAAVSAGDAALASWAEAALDYTEEYADGKIISKMVFALYDTSLPTGYVWCDGGSSSPDLRSAFPRGAAAAGGAVGGTGGSATHTLVSGEMPAHVHTITRKTGAGVGAGVKNANDPVSTDLNTGSTGGGGAHQNLPPYEDVNWIMKT